MSGDSEGRTVLIIDDDALFCDATRDYLRKPGRTVLAVGTGAEGVTVCESRRVDVVLLDKNLPDIEGSTLCPQLLELNEQTKIIFITAHPSFDSAVEALRAGAVDYLSKPFEPEELSLAVEQAIRTLDLEDVEHLAKYRSQKEQMKTVLVGSDGGLVEVAKLIALASAAGAPVLITGETGAGKNIAAKGIHYSSQRKDKPFITVNCAALPENLIEAELFGYEKGAFTGAAGSHRGVFEMAAGGTLFLDEIGEIPIHLQSKLLGVLEDNELRRLGSESTRTVNVHVVAATAANLEEALDVTFRGDLYFRLSVMRIHMPRLSEHHEDIPALCQHFLAELRGPNAPSLSEAELNRLMAYPWPGNVRELRNILERATIVQPGPIIEPSKLLGSSNNEVSAPKNGAGASEDHLHTLEEVEKEHIRFVLNTLENNYTHTAETLGVAISTLKRKLKKYGLLKSR